MDKGTRPRLGFLIGVLLCSLAFGFIAAVTSEERNDTDDTGLIFPPNHSVLLSGNFDVICSADHSPLEVDGHPQAWEPFEPPVRVKRVGLSPGFHQIRVGDRRLDFVVALNPEEHDGPDNWQIFKLHSIKSDEHRCADCHKTEQQNGQIAVGELLPYTACFECHEPVDFDVTHSHPLEPLEPCQMCHALHGSSRKALLKAPVKQLCDECHES